MPRSHLAVREATWRSYLTQYFGNTAICCRLGWFAGKPRSRRSAGSRGGAAGGRETAAQPSEPLPGHIQPRQVLRARGTTASLKIDVLFALLLTGQPSTVKTRRRLHWEFWLRVLCKPKYGPHEPCSAGARHAYQ